MKRFIYETLIGLAFLSIVGVIGYYVFDYYTNYDFNSMYAMIIGGTLITLGVSKLIGSSITTLKVKHENN